MVYCGKPSKSCDPCRARRTKCDRATPSCSQCRRVGRVCPGYRDEQDLMFKDQTAKLAKRVRAARKMDTHIVPAQDAGQSASVARHISFVLQQPSRNMRDEATTYFFFSYNYEHNHPWINSDRNYLADLYRRANSIGAPMTEAIDACGLATMGNARKSQELIFSSQISHWKAIQGLQAALRDPDLAKSDMTFLTVLHLHLYEVMASSHWSRQASDHHCHGLRALLTLRRHETLKTEIGRRLFSHARSMITATCLHLQEPLPDIVVELTQNSLHREVNVEDELYMLIIDICKLLHLQKVQGGLDPSTCAEALSLDADMEEWATACRDKGLGYEVVPDPDSTHATYRYNFESVWLSSMWLTYWTFRILLNEMIVGWTHGHLDADDIEGAKVLVKCKTVQTQMSEDICASIAYFFDMSENGVGDKAVGGFALIWPLHTIATATYRTSNRTTWVIDQYERISEHHGIPQALQIAQTLRTKRTYFSHERGESQRETDLARLNEARAQEHREICEGSMDHFIEF